MTCTLRRNGLARTGVSMVVIKQILTATEYNRISSIPLDNATPVIAKPTVPLPLSNDAMDVLLQPFTTHIFYVTIEN
jgi:hypothetical protein